MKGTKNAEWLFSKIWLLRFFWVWNFWNFFCTSQFGSFHKKIGQEKNSKKCWVTRIFDLCLFYNFEFFLIFLLTSQVIITKKRSREKEQKMHSDFFWNFFLRYFFIFFSSYFSNWVGSSNKKDRTREKEQRMLSVFFRIFDFLCVFFEFFC